jgi:hypothetical protein
VIIAIPSIQHTGTHFVRTHHLGKYERLEISEPVPRCWWRGDYVYQAHLMDGHMEYWPEILLKVPAIVPLRHPYLVFETWKRESAKGVPGREPEILVRYWETLINEIDRYNPFYLPIDSPNREEYVGRINKVLRLDLSMRFPVIHSKQGTGELTPNDVEVNSITNELVDRHKTFFERFYEI